MSSAIRFNRGAPVALRPRKGCCVPTYAKVVGHPSPSTVRVIATADGGGRKRGETVTVSPALLTPRKRGQHRKSARLRPRIAGWWGR